VTLKTAESHSVSTKTLQFNGDWRPEKLKSSTQKSADIRFVSAADLDGFSRFSA
jgi:hypothetical protein